MKVNLLGSLLIGSLLLFSSCKDENKEDKTPEPKETEFSKLSEEEKKDFNTSVWAKLVSYGTTTSFSRSAVSAGLPDLLTNTKDITVFAPSNEAFEALNENQKEVIQNPSQIENLRALLKSHIVTENLSSVDIVQRLNDADVLELETLSGATIKIVKADLELFLLTAKGDSTKIIMSDLKASNGHIHVIDKFDVN